LRGLAPSAIFTSARTGEGIDEILAVISEKIPSPNVELELLVPYERGDIVSALHERGSIASTDYEEGGTRLHVRVKPTDVANYDEFLAAQPA
jgi:GTP-binding protein HflX